MSDAREWEKDIAFRKRLVNLARARYFDGLYVGTICGVIFMAFLWWWFG